MKTSMKNKNILQALTGILFVSVLVVGALSIAPLAHAQEDDDFGGDVGDSCCSVSPDTYGSVSPDTYGNVYPDTYSNVYPDTESNVYPDTYSETPSDEYSSPSSYSSSGYSTGSYYTAPTPVYQTPVVYNTPSNTTSNTCTNNSCNNTITNPAPVINNVVTYPPAQTYVPPVTQYCASGYYGTYPNCYLNQQPIVYQTPVAYNTATPYVTLTQVPYTGLDLGFWGSIAYWGAMVLFALVVAYLVAIARVQNVIALKLKHFLFGTADTEDETAVVVAPAQVAQVTFAPVAQSSEDVIDSFIMSQVNRPRHA